MVDDFHGDFAAVGRIEGAALRGVEIAPGVFVNFGAQGAFEFVLRKEIWFEIGQSDVLEMIAIFFTGSHFSLYIQICYESYIKP